MLKRTGIFGLQLGLSLALITGFAASVVAQITVAQITPSRRTNTNTTVTQEGDRFDIGGGQLSRDEANLFHQFEQFGLSQDQIARFLSNPEIRNILATVDGGDASIINGLLQVSGSNANLYLLNPAGILFGPEARLDVAGSFYANTANGLTFGDRTLDIFGNPDFADLVGDPTGFSFSGLNPGVVVNAGNLAVPTGETLSLIGGTVINTGTLSAPEGTITIAAIPGETHVRLSQDGALLSLDVLPDGLAALPTNPASLPELLTGGNVPDVGLVIEPDGTVRLVAETPVTIPDVPGVAIASGTLNVAGSMGGAIDVVGDRVGLIAASLMADGTNGGGHIRIGGDYQGGGTLPTASRTYVSADSSLSANADTTGDGGRIIIWADGSTAYSGTLSATGGTLSGNGGFAEVSGRQNLGYDGTADLSAPNGTPGTLLLDPENIIIGAVGTDDGELGDGSILINDRPGETLFISEAALEASVGDIRVEANGDITVNPLTPNIIPGTFAPGSPGDICSTTGCLYLNNPGSSVTFVSETGNFESNLDNYFLFPSVNLTIEARNITIGNINLSNPSAISGDAGDIRLDASQNLNVGSVRTVVANSNNTDILGEGGTIELEAGGSITVTGTLTSWSNNGNAGDITAQAGNGIQINCTSDTFCLESFAGGFLESIPIDNSGDITLSTTQGDILIVTVPPQREPDDAIPNSGLINSGTSSRDGEPGDVSITALEGSVLIGEVDSFETLNLIRLRSIGIVGDATDLPEGSTQNSASLNIQAGDSIAVGFITNRARSGDAESIVLEAPRISVTGIDSSSPDNAGGTIEINGDLILQENFLVNATGDTSGNITFAGIIQGDHTVTANGGVVRFAEAVDVDNLIVNAENTIVDADISANSTLDFRSPLSIAGNQDLVFQASEINFSDSVQGTGGQLLLRPSQTDQNIALGGSVDTDAFDLSSDELGRLDDFGQINIGRPDGTGDINVIGNTLFNDPVVLEPGQGTVQLSANLISTGTDISLGNTVLTNDVNLSSAGGAIRFLGTVNGGHDLTLQTGAGDVLFANTVGSDTPLQDLAIDTTGSVTFGDAVTLAGTLDLGAASFLQLGGDLQVGEDLAIAPPITVTNSLSITSGGGLTLGNAVSSPGAANDLVLAANGGVLSVQAVDTNGGTLRLEGRDGIAINGVLDTTEQGTGGDLTVASAILGGRDLTVQTGAGDVLFANTVGSDTPLQDLAIDTTGSVTFGDVVTLSGSLNLGAASGLQLGGDLQVGEDLAIASPITVTNSLSITSGGGLTLGNAVSSPGAANDLVLAANGGVLSVQAVDTNGGTLRLEGRDGIAINGVLDTTGQGTGGDLTVASAILGGRDLTVQTGAGDVLFANTVGSDTPLQDLAIDTTGSVTFGDAVTLSGSLDVGAASGLQLGGDLQVGEDLAIAPPITVTNSLSITSGGGLTLGNAVSSPGAANDLALTANGGVLSVQTVDTNGGNLRLDGSDGIAINGVLDTTGQGTGGDLTVASAILGGQDLTVQSGAGNVFFADTVGSDTPLQDLTVDTTGIVTFGDDVTLRGVLDLGTASTLRLGGDLQTLAGNLVLQTPITVIDDASITAAGNLRLTEDVQSAGGANALALNAGGSSLTTQNIDTNGGDLTLRSPQFLTAGNLTTSNAAGGGDLTVIAGTQITTGDIDTSALTGDGGDVFIDPTDDIQTGFINSQSRDAAGGDVTAITGSLFRSINTFVAADGTLASISAIGGTQGGNITLSHFGGAERVPFLVGSAAANGTAGAIATGTPGNINAIFPNRVFPGSYDQFGTAGDIRLITQDFPVPDPDLERTSGWEIREEIDRFDIDQWIFGLEYYFTRMSERYLGNEDTAIRTVDEVRAILQAIERQTGERPAIIYAFFYPEIATRSENEVPLEITWLGGTADDTNTDERSQDSLHLVLVTADDDPILARVPNATRDEVPEIVQEFRQRILRGERNSGDRTYMPLARQAYSLLLEPLETLLQERGITNLVYVMEPGLRSTPLAAMMDANGFIIERYSLGQMPSVSLTDTTYTGIGGTEVLAGGISDFSGFSTLNPLPGAAMEAQTIGQQLWPDALLINERVTRAELMQIYNNEPHGIVHLATHADFVEGDISESYIQLHGERLHLDEIREMGWGNDPTVRLLVLSACNTATGSVEVELGFGGIATQAGVQSVLASLWKVNDAGTLALMAAFYEQLGRPEVTIKAEALRQAQRMMVGENIGFQGGYLTGTEATIILSDEMAELDNLYPTHPYYWSGFTMLGSPW